MLNSGDLVEHPCQKVISNTCIVSTSRAYNRTSDVCNVNNYFLIVT